MVMYLLNVEVWSSGKEYVKLICIGDDVWLGGGVIVCFGVMIGDWVVIGVGSVVICDILVDSFVVGNFCWVIWGID